MSDNSKKLFNNQGKNQNKLIANNQLTSENNEINYEYSTEENKSIINQDNNDITEENELATENRLNANIDSKIDEEIEIGENINNEQKSENNEGSLEIEDELRLVTLNFISICQCCKNRFNKGKYLPYLLKCGHFFCLNCINQYFTDKTGIVCPSDGLVAKSVKELKLLKNLILNLNTKNKKKEIQKKIKSKDNNYEKSDYYNYMKSNLKNYDPENNNNDTNYKMNYCRIHKNQKLTHIICDTNEIICVHCAFEMLKLNPSLQIKEIKEKYNDLSSFIDDIMGNSQKNIDIIQNTIELIRKNKENEIKKVKFFYNNLIKYLEAEKQSKIQKIENISKDNIHNLEQKLLIFNEIIEQGDEFLYNLEKDEGDINQNYSSVINNYNNILKLNQSNQADNNRNKLKYIKFINKDSTYLKEYLNKMANINIINRIIKYNINIKPEEESDIIKPLKDYASNTNTSTMRYYKRIVKKQFNKKNISSESLMEQRSQNESSKYPNLNSSVKVKNSDYFNKIQYNSNTYELNKKNKTLKTSKTPMVNPHFKKIVIQGKSKLNNRRSLLKNYFDIKSQDNYNSNLNEENNLFFHENAESVKSSKNSKSFNNLNILNNFYNLDYSRRSPNNNDINKRKYVNEEQIKLYKESLNKLIPKQLKDVKFD